LDGVYRLSSFDEKVGLSFNQYLIKDERPTLVHTGSAVLFRDVAEALRQVIRLEEIAYLFISHFEADECGSLSKLTALARNLVPVCSAVTARQLLGFGIHDMPLVKKPGDTLSLGRRRLRFLAYPSEMHLWEGLLAYEEVDRVLFTSDLFIRRGRVEQAVVEGSRAEFGDIPAASIPSEEGRRACLEALSGLEVRLMALGHGPAVRVE
jgi:flavorubredoxin